jgi:hypothetical protein
MKFRIAQFVVLCSLAFIAMGCTDGNDTRNFAKVGDSLAHNLKQLNLEHGIIMSGFSSNPSQNLLKIGLEMIFLNDLRL